MSDPSRRDFLFETAGMLAGLGIASVAQGQELKPIIQKHIFMTKPAVLGYYLDQSEPLEPEYSYFQRQSKVFLKKEYAGRFSPMCNNPRTWGEMIVTERHLRNSKRTCSAECICHKLEPYEEFHTIHIKAIWTENTKFLPTIPYNWRELPGFKDRYPCSFCGSDEAFSFQHDDSRHFPSGFYCSPCNNRIATPLFADNWEEVKRVANIMACERKYGSFLPKH